MRRKFTGLNTTPKLRNGDIGRGALYIQGSGTGTFDGGYRRENAGMSSERKVRILPAEYLRFPE